MNSVRQNSNIFIVMLLIAMPSLNYPMLKRPVRQLSVIKPFLSNVSTIATIKKIMDEIEVKKLGYEDYSKRTGLIWSDVLVKTAKEAKIVKEFDTEKVTQVLGALKTHKPQSILNYPTLESIVSKEILPKMFDTISAWIKLPETVFAQIFFQRCSASEAMDWHQDPGEDFEPQADYSVVLMLSEQGDSTHGWAGGEFKIRPGLPEDKYNEKDVETIIPCYNQAIIFNNQINNHAATAVSPLMQESKRDIIVIPINLTKLPIKKD